MSSFSLTLFRTCARLQTKTRICSNCRASVWKRQSVRHCVTGAIEPAGITGQPKTYPEHINKIVNDISSLSLLEVADLNELLKKTLNIPDTPMMAMGAMQAMPSAAKEDEEEEAQTSTKTAFTVRLTEFDPAKKIALIKHIKSIMEGMNLVQAKKFVESAPTDVKTDMTKDEAESLKQALEAVGAKVDIE